MKHCEYLYISLLIGCFSLPVEAQQEDFKATIPPREAYLNDSIRTYVVDEITVYPSFMLEAYQEDAQYRKLVRDVKKTLPFAKMVYATLIETYEYMETLPDDKAREKHLKQLEKDLYDEYFPVLKKMTLSQGKLLIKLIDRECNSSSYELVRVFLGSFRAGFWNMFASVFGASLKSEWDPEGRDAAAERVVQLVEMGQL